MNEADVTALIADILEIDPSSLELSASLDELDWDSLATLSFIAEVDSQGGAKLDAAALATCTTPAELVALATSPRE